MKRILWAAAAFLIIALIIFAPPSLSPPNLLQQVRDAGPLAPLLFVGFYIVACVAFIPGSILTLGAGAVFGVVTGSVLVSIGSVIGATCAFFIARYLARDWAKGQVAKFPKLSAVDKAVGKEGGKIVLLTRLSPLFPFNVLNYFYGITSVRATTFILASWIGMLPGTVLYVYLGAAGGDLATLGSKEGGRTPAEWALFAVGLLTTLGVTIFITKVAKKAIDAKL